MAEIIQLRKSGDAQGPLVANGSLLNLEHGDSSPISAPLPPDPFSEDKQFLKDMWQLRELQMAMADRLMGLNWSAEADFMAHQALGVGNLILKYVEAIKRAMGRV